MNLRKIREKIGEYYEENRVPAPPAIEKREFGAGNQDKIDFRHLSFEDEDDLNKFLVSEKPRFISYSAAYYEYPGERPMKRKEYEKADLVFEFDAECSHDTLTCYQCLEEVKMETEKLINDFLIKDFGYKKKNIHVFYSGNRGYHVHVRSPKARDLSPEARKEIVDYLLANDLFTPDFKENGPKPDGKGWRGKIARELYKFVKEGDKEKMKEIGIPRKKRKNLIERRDEILQGIKEGNYDTLPGPKSLWTNILENKVVNLTAQIDHPVTMDTSRLMRVPETLHGGSALIATKVKDLDSFHPFEDAVAFGEDPLQIQVTENVSKLHLNGESHGPYEAGQDIEVPEYLAMFLTCKNKAKPKW